MTLMNRLHNVTNPHQGKAKKVLCVCSAGLLRSPTAAFVLSNPPFNFNTRAAGLDAEYALIYADDVLLSWADQIVCMEASQRDRLTERLEALGIASEVLCLNIPDRFARMDEELQEMIALRYEYPEQRT